MTGKRNRKASTTISADDLKDDLTDEFAKMRHSLGESFKHIGVQLTAQAVGMSATDLRAIQEAVRLPTDSEAARINKALSEQLNFA